MGPENTKKFYTNDVCEPCYSRKSIMILNFKKWRKKILCSLTLVYNRSAAWFSSLEKTGNKNKYDFFLLHVLKGFYEFTWRGREKFIWCCLSSSCSGEPAVQINVDNKFFSPQVRIDNSSADSDIHKLIRLNIDRNVLSSSSSLSPSSSPSGVMRLILEYPGHGLRQTSSNDFF